MCTKNPLNWLCLVKKRQKLPFLAKNAQKPPLFQRFYCCKADSRPLASLASAAKNRRLSLSSAFGRRPRCLFAVLRTARLRARTCAHCVQRGIPRCTSCSCALSQRGARTSRTSCAMNYCAFFIACYAFSIARCIAARCAHSCNFVRNTKLHECAHLAGFYGASSQAACAASKSQL